MKKKFILSMALLIGAMTIVSCSSDDKNDNGGNTNFDLVTTTPIVDEDSYAANTSGYDNKVFGQSAIDACGSLEDELTAANSLIATAQRDRWARETAYVYPGPIQYWGPTEVCDQPTKTLALEQSK